MLIGTASEAPLVITGPTGEARARIMHWGESQIVGEVPAGDARRIALSISGRDLASLDHSCGAVHLSPSEFRINTRYLPAYCIGELSITVEHADGTRTRLEHDFARRRSSHTARSLFGGMWIDFPNWEVRLSEKIASHTVSEELADQIRRFVTDGCVIIPQIVSAELIETINSDIRKIWAGDHPGHKVEVYSLPSAPVSVVDVDRRFYGEPHKLLDPYAFVPAARAAAAAPAVVAFLDAIFEEKPKAFQQLAFEWGSEQAIHKDSAYVKIDGNPMSMVATWLALEDIVEGTGELEYFVESHRSPDYVFGSLSKWMESAPQEHDDFLASIQADAINYKQERRTFLAKAGDVLIWHADLAHGGSQITRPGRTRRSLVTHFTASSNAPYYRRSSNFRTRDAHGVEFVSSYANIAEI